MTDAVTFVAKRREIDSVDVTFVSEEEVINIFVEIFEKKRYAVMLTYIVKCVARIIINRKLLKINPEWLVGELIPKTLDLQIN